MFGKWYRSSTSFGGSHRHRNGLPLAMLDFCMERLHLGDLPTMATGRTDTLHCFMFIILESDL